MLSVYLPGVLRDRLARAAFEAGAPVSALVERAVQAALDAAEAPSPAHDAPRARWVDMGPASGWAAQGAACPADPTGALLFVRPAEGGWRWHVQAASAVVDGGQELRSRTAAMLEAEAQAAALTAERAEELVRRRARRRGR